MASLTPKPQVDVAFGVSSLEVTTRPGGAIALRSSLLSKPKFNVTQAINAKEKSLSSVDLSQFSNEHSSSDGNPSISLNEYCVESLAQVSHPSPDACFSVSSTTKATTSIPGFLPLDNGGRDEGKGINPKLSGQALLFSSSAGHPGQIGKTLTTSKSGASATAAVPDTIEKATKTTTTKGFVFGENLGDRAENFTFSYTDEKCNEKAAKLLEPSSLEEKSIFQSSFQSTNSWTRGNSPTLSYVSLNSTNNSKSSPISEIPNQSTNGSTIATKSLNESAAEYCQNQAAVKRKFDEVTPVTGEEEEVNVNQFQAKLYVFEKSSGSWVEKGRGILRLNDVQDKSQSRLVMRTSGSLRVILNTQVYPEMSVERPSEKSVRFTGLHEGNVRIYLISGAPRDIQLFFEELAMRKKRSVIMRDNNTSNDESLNANSKKMKKSI